MNMIILNSRLSDGSLEPILHNGKDLSKVGEIMTFDFISDWVKEFTDRKWDDYYSTTD
jgi:hypothetical protein